MAFEVQVYIVAIAFALFLGFRRALYPKEHKTMGSFLWPLVIAATLAPPIWMVIAIIWSVLIR